jgi:hypothetical protein
LNSQKVPSKGFAYRSLLGAIYDLAVVTIVAFNGLISGHLALKVSRQVIHSIVLKKKVTTTY